LRSSHKSASWCSVISGRKKISANPPGKPEKEGI
jgi:hypothetical protein